MRRDTALGGAAGRDTAAAAQAPGLGARWGAITRRLGVARVAAIRDAFFVVVTTRLLVWSVAVAAAQIGGATTRFDNLALTHPFGSFGNAIFSPLARWDATWYLEIAAHGYNGGAQGFFPLYPGAIRLVTANSHSPGVLLAGSYVVTLIAFFGALYFLHRLVTLELGDRYARRSLLLLALFPGAIWFGAPFTESLFLLLAVGSVYAARTGHWAWAGVTAALASATRSPGVVLIVPLLILWWRATPRRRRDLGWVALAPAGIVAFSAYLGVRHGDALAWQHLQERVWYHHFVPLGGVFTGTRAAFDGVRQLISGQHAHVYFTDALVSPLFADPFPVAWHNIQDWCFLVFGIVALAGVVRRLPVAYSAYSAVSLFLVVSVPSKPLPNASIVRYEAVVFPFFMWLALVCKTRRRLLLVLGVFTLLLVFETVRFATWHWVA